MTDLNLGIIGNCSYSLLVNQQGRVVWCCLPRIDSEPVFSDLLGEIERPEADRRLLRTFGEADYFQLEPVGERAFQLHDQHDAGMWELRTRDKVRTSTSLMCWAACDRLAKIASHLELMERAVLWSSRAHSVRKCIESRAWSPALNSFVDSFGGEEYDASLMLMAEVGFLAPDDPRFVGTVSAIEAALSRGRYLFRYAAPDDFGAPETAYTICTFWYIEAHTAMGRDAEARDIFDHMLACRNHVGLLSEDLDPETGEMWGNYPQTYSLVGIINCAMRLSRRWEDLL